MRTQVDIIFYKLIADECDARQFEQLIYLSPDVESELSDDDYLSLISINYKLPSAVYDAKNIIKRYVDISKYYEWYLLKLLKNILDRAPAVHVEIEECYHLYCEGLGFIDNLAIGFGLAIAAPPPCYSADSWDKLTEPEKVDLIDNMYPEVAEEAEKTVNWIKCGKVILDCSSFGGAGLGFIDNRDALDRQATRYKNGL